MKDFVTLLVATVAVLVSEFVSCLVLVRPPLQCLQGGFLVVAVFLQDVGANYLLAANAGPSTNGMWCSTFLTEGRTYKRTI